MSSEYCRARPEHRGTDTTELGTDTSMYGSISQIVAVEGRRPELASVLIGIGPTDGCLSYIVAEDSSREDALWVTELWESEQAQAASLELPRVQEAIERCRPLIVGFEQRIVTTPIGGVGLGE